MYCSLGCRVQLKDELNVIDLTLFIHLVDRDRDGSKPLLSAIWP